MSLITNPEMTNNEFYFSLSKQLHLQLIRMFVGAQNKGVATLLEDALIYYSCVEPFLVIHYAESEECFCSALWKQRHAIVIPPSLTNVLIRIESGNRVGIHPEEAIAEALYPPVKEGYMSVNLKASPIPGIEAMKRVERLEEEKMPAALAFFSTVRTQGMSLGMNACVAEFAGMSREDLAKDESIGLFVKTEAMESLNKLQDELRVKGSVTDFPLISGRTNGDYGVFTIDAVYVDWFGLEARLTIYKDFSPMPVQTH